MASTSKATWYKSHVGVFYLDLSISQRYPVDSILKKNSDQDSIYRKAAPFIKHVKELDNQYELNIQALIQCLQGEAKQ